MRKLLITALIIFLSGCASKGDLMERNVSPVQTYRLANDPSPVKISGKLERIYDGFSVAKLNDEFKRELSIYFNDILTIKGRLNNNYTGELSGLWNSKPVSTSCSGNRVSPTWTDVRCIVFIENERTVTLTF